MRIFGGVAQADGNAAQQRRAAGKSGHAHSLGPEHQKTFADRNMTQLGYKIDR